MTPPLDTPEDGPPILETGPEEPDLHELGGTPPALMGIPDPDEVSEEDWLEANG